MRVSKEKIVAFIRERGDEERAVLAEAELPDTWTCRRTTTWSRSTACSRSTWPATSRTTGEGREPLVRFELTTFRLQGECSTS